MSELLFGKPVVDEIEMSIRSQLAHVQTSPKLVIIQVGHNQESTTYINHKKKFGEKLGIKVDHKIYQELITQTQLIEDIKKLNDDQNVTGIIIQLPISKHLSNSDVLDAIDPNKDVDGLTSKNFGHLMGNEPGFIPATTKAVLALLDHTKVDVKGKKVVIVGHSLLVGKPTALALINRNATVTVCHIHTKDLAQETKRADILIVATGQRHLITKDFVSAHQIVIDIGITVVPESEQAHLGKKVVGDVDFKNVEDHVAAITPVPGGIGPITVACLFENVTQAFIQNNT